MNRTSWILAAALLVSCSEDWIAAPAAVEPDEAFVWAKAVGDHGVCIEGARIEIVSGQQVGRGAVQETPCDEWTDFGGIFFDGLRPGVEVILRATAPGYAADEEMAVPMPYGQAVILAPAPLPLCGAPGETTAP